MKSTATERLEIAAASVISNSTRPGGTEVALSCSITYSMKRASLRVLPDRLIE